MGFLEVLLQLGLLYFCLLDAARVSRVLSLRFRVPGFTATGFRGG